MNGKVCLNSNLGPMKKAQEGYHLTYSRLPTNRNFVHGGPTGRAAQRHCALGKRKGIAMVTPDKKPPKKHFVEIPADINELTDTEIDAWAEQTYSQIMAQLKSEIVKEENGYNA